MVTTYTQSSTNTYFHPSGVTETNMGIYITGTAAPVGETLTKATFYINVSNTTSTGTFECNHISSSGTIKQTSSDSYTYTSSGDKTMVFNFNGAAIAENDYILVRNCTTTQNWDYWIYDAGSGTPPFTNMIWSQQYTGNCTTIGQDNKSSKNAKFIVETSSSTPGSATVLLPPPYSEIVM